jgi:hypothetical protein
MGESKSLTRCQSEQDCGRSLLGIGRFYGDLSLHNQIGLGASDGLGFPCKAALLDRHGFSMPIRPTQAPVCPYMWLRSFCGSI